MDDSTMVFKNGCEFAQERKKKVMGMHYYIIAPPNKFEKLLNWYIEYIQDAANIPVGISQIKLKVVVIVIIIF